MTTLRTPLLIALTFGFGLPLLVIILTKSFGAHESLAVAYGAVVFMAGVSVFMALGLIAVVLELKSNPPNEGSSPLWNVALFLFIGWHMVNGIPGAVDKVMEEQFYSEATGSITIGVSDEISRFFGPRSGSCSHVKNSSGNNPLIIRTQLDDESIELCGIHIDRKNPLGYMMAPTDGGVKIRFGRWPNGHFLISSKTKDIGES